MPCEEAMSLDDRGVWLSATELIQRTSEVVADLYLKAEIRARQVEPPCLHDLDPWIGEIVQNLEVSPGG